MKIYKWIALIIFFMLIPIYVHSADYDYSGDKEKPLTTPYMKTKSSGDQIFEDNTATVKENKADTGQKTQGKQVKADSVCIGKDCRDKWPVFKCANYEGRPAGETGDQFCASMNKTCMAVFIGGGQSFFDQCSIPVNSVHECRCCWAE